MASVDLCRAQRCASNPIRVQRNAAKTALDDLTPGPLLHPDPAGRHSVREPGLRPITSVDVWISTIDAVRGRRMK